MIECPLSGGQCFLKWMGSMRLFCKRIYDAQSPEDGCRILVDRLWPRGISKERAALAYWRRDIAPSTELRKWYAHDPAHFAEFKAKYWLELEASDTAAGFLELVREHLKKENVTLLYGARDREHNHALCLQEWLLDAGVEEERYMPGPGNVSRRSGSGEVSRDQADV